MEIVLFDDCCWGRLRPLTLTRPACELRVGILTIREKWEKRLNMPASFFTREYLRKKYSLNNAEDQLWINGAICPDRDLCEQLMGLNPGKGFKKGNVFLAFRSGAKEVTGIDETLAGYIDFREYEADLTHISYPYHIFEFNHKELLADFYLLTKGRESQPLNESVRVYGTHPVFVEPGAVVESAIINTNEGPVYIGHHAEVMEGVVIRGPLALCEHAVLKVGAKAYGATTLGPYCKCGGELRNVVLIGCSNKAHDGYLGNSVIGEWCNIGAGTSVSNLKNNYAEVKLWDYDIGRFRKTGLQFCGLIMGDHSKMGINMMINTGTVVGLGANLYGADFPRNYIPSFTWGSSAGYMHHQWGQFMETAHMVMKRRGKLMDETEQEILQYLYAHPEG